MAKVKISVKHNLEDVAKTFADIHGVMKRATASALNQTAQQVKAEGARQMFDTKYASKRWTIGKIRQSIKITKKASLSKPIDQQETKIQFAGPSIPVVNFSPKNKTFKTRVGPRYGVTVEIFGKRINTGAFHVKGKDVNWKQGSPKGKGTFDATSRLFVNDHGDMKRYKFLNPQGVLRLNNGIDRLEKWGYGKLVDNFETQWDRAVQQLHYSKNRVRKRP